MIFYNGFTIFDRYKQREKYVVHKVYGNTPHIISKLVFYIYLNHSRSCAIFQTASTLTSAVCVPYYMQLNAYRQRTAAKISQAL